MKIKEFLMLNIMPFAIKLVLYPVGATLRISEHGNAAFSPRTRPKEGVIYAFWHSRIITAVFYFRKRAINVLVSMGRDGEFIARVIEKFGFQSTRGSTSKEGFRAFLGLKKVLKAGNFVAITPDGPRGPKQTAQLGAVYLAKVSGFPVTPFSFDSRKKWVLNSWDNFIIPKPFSKGVFVWGKEIYVPKDADDKMLEEKRLELETELNRLTEEAASLCRSSL